MSTPYYSIASLLDMVDSTQRNGILDLHTRICRVGNSQPGSTKNHQAWVGGYLDHVSEVLNLGYLLYATLEGTGRLRELDTPERFSLSDVLVVLYLHDLEKAFRIQLDDKKMPIVEAGKYLVYPTMKSKSDREAFKYKLIQEAGIVLTSQQEHALRYVEGIRDTDYSPHNRVMLPLDSLCHMCDMLSARMFYDFPKKYGDSWSVIGRQFFKPIPLV